MKPKKRKKKSVAMKWVRWGKGLMGRRLRRMVGRANRLQLVSAGEYRLYISRDDLGSVAESLRRHGEYEKRITDFFSRVVKPGDCVLDIGANIGYYSVLFSRLVGSDGKVFSFEPDAQNYDTLCRNIALNSCANVEALNLALSDKTGEQVFYTDKTHYGVHSLARENLIHEGGAATVPTLTMDEFAVRYLNGRKVSLIKIDTQGAEGLVFSHAERCLDPEGLHILMEYWPYGLRSFGTDPELFLKQMHGRGFEFMTMNKQGEINEIAFGELLDSLAQRQFARYSSTNLILKKSAAMP